MTLTIWSWILVIFIALCGLGVVIYQLYWEERLCALIAGLVTIALCVGTAFALSWWLTSTASGARCLKDYKSELNNGLNREITITAEDGREIFHYEGTVDIQTNHNGNSNYILFEDENGLRYVIYYGIQDTVIIQEKSE